MTDLWEEISPASHPAELRIRRVDPDHPLDFFYGRDHRGSYAFIFRGPLPDREIPVLPLLTGIELSLTGMEKGAVELQLRLPDPGQADIFKALCMNLMSATRSLDRKSGSAGIEIILARLIRWQELLKARREKLLTQSQITGLIGEILLLRDLFLPRLSPTDAVAAWRGPYGDEQDFLFGACMIEVKTQLGSADRKLQISSVDQLDTVSGEIFLCHQTLGVGEAGGTDCFSLNSLADALIEDVRIKSAAAADLLCGALIEFGYMHRSEYDDQFYILTNRNYYRVADGFPSLRSAMIPAGVTDVKYCISLDACYPYFIAEEEAIKSIFV